MTWSVGQSGGEARGRVRVRRRKGERGMGREGWYLGRNIKYRLSDYLEGYTEGYTTDRQSDSGEGSRSPAV